MLEYREQLGAIGVPGEKPLGAREVLRRLYFVKNKQRGRNQYSPTSTLLKLYWFLIEPYISYGLTAWRQAANSSLNKILILQKRAVRLMYFSDRRAHAIPLFVRSGVLPLNMLYFKYLAILMYDISNNRAPSKISELFVPSNDPFSLYQIFCRR